MGIWTLGDLRVLPRDYPGRMRHIQAADRFGPLDFRVSVKKGETRASAAGPGGPPPAC